MIATFILIPFAHWLENILGPLLPKIIIFIIIVMMMLPKSYYIRIYAYSNYHGYLAGKPGLRDVFKYLSTNTPNDNNPQVEAEKLIDQRVPKDRCVLNIYGWHVASFYIYTKRQPCTRFFLPNIVGQDWQREEYRSSVLN